MSVSTSNRRGQRRGSVSVPIRWRNYAWQPRLVVRPGAPGFTWLTLAQPHSCRRIRGYRRLLKGPRLLAFSRALRRNGARINLWRLH